MLSNREELTKHITSEFEKNDKATCNNIIKKLIKESKLIEMKYAKKKKKKIRLVYPSIISANNKFDEDKKNLKVEVMTL